MSGIYIHIPFCKKVCTYCNFHFSTTYHKHGNELVSALIKEIKLRQNYLTNKNIESIYFGGGTPSLLTVEEINQIIITIEKYYIFDKSNIEITLEANPDDLSYTKLLELKKAGINRLSIGIQSFDDKDLLLMNRSHTSKQAIDSILNAQKIGITNINIDLIFALPNQTLQKWIENINISKELNIPHLSIYNLTIEDKTKLAFDLKRRKYKVPLDDIAKKQFYAAKTILEELGYEHYEISNYCKPNFRAIHNSNYWKDKQYIGIGPSAHSYNKDSRQWNIANNIRYIKSIKDNKLIFEKEILSEAERYNEYIITGLRTKWGCNLHTISKISSVLKSNFLKSIKQHIDDKNIIVSAGNYTISKKGLIISDLIITDLLYV